MNLWFRLTWLWIVGRWRPQVHSLGPCRTPFRVSLFDLDLFRHMNNGRYFTIMYLARVDLMHRSGTLVKLNRAGLYPVVTAESLIFRKSLNWRQRFEIDLGAGSADTAHPGPRPRRRHPDREAPQRAGRR